MLVNFRFMLEEELHSVEVNWDSIVSDIRCDICKIVDEEDIDIYLNDELLDLDVEVSDTEMVSDVILMVCVQNWKIAINKLMAIGVDVDDDMVYEIAVMSSDIETIKLLLIGGVIEPHSEGSSVYSIHIAINGGDDDIVKLMANHYDDYNCDGWQYVNKSLLEFAVEFGRIDLAIWLIDMGAELSFQNRFNIFDCVLLEDSQRFYTYLFNNVDAERLLFNGDTCECSVELMKRLVNCESFEYIHDAYKSNVCRHGSLYNQYVNTLPIDCEGQIYDYLRMIGILYNPLEINDDYPDCEQCGRINCECGTICEDCEYDIPSCRCL